MSLKTPPEPGSWNLGPRGIPQDMQTVPHSSRSPPDNFLLHSSYSLSLQFLVQTSECSQFELSNNSDVACSLSLIAPPPLQDGMFYLGSQQDH